MRLFFRLDGAETRYGLDVVHGIHGDDDAWGWLIWRSGGGELYRGALDYDGMDQRQAMGEVIATALDLLGVAAQESDE